MNKAVVGGIVTLLAVVVGAVVVMANNKDDASQSTSASGAMSAGQTETGGGFMSAPDASVDEVQSGEVMMDIKDFAFGQKTLKIKKGTKVTWTNRDEARHDVTPDTESAAFVASKLLGQGESYSFTFDTAGTYSYICSPHPYMKASVEVVE